MQTSLPVFVYSCLHACLHRITSREAGLPQDFTFQSTFPMNIGIPILCLLLSPFNKGFFFPANHRVPCCAGGELAAGSPHNKKRGQLELNGYDLFFLKLFSNSFASILYPYVVVVYNSQIVKNTTMNVQTISVQAIQHYIKKSTLNLEHHTSAGTGTQATLLSGLIRTHYVG